jgi:hypothetical protein
VLLNTTATGAVVPSFAAKVDFPTGSGPSFVAIGDLNGDGKPDLAVANRIAATVAVFFNTTPTGATTPSFAAEVEFTTGQGVPTVAIGDINGDGKLDLAVSDSHTGTVSVLLNTTGTGAATPSFAAKVDLTIGSPDAGLAVAIGDVNRDGKPDIVVTNTGLSIAAILFNTTATNATTPSFATESDFPTGSAGPAAIAIGDLNGDSSPDLAIANYDLGTIAVLLDTTAMSATTPSFGTEVGFPTNSGFPSVVIGDLNGDGRPDLAVANSDATGVSVLANTTTTGAATPNFAAKIDFMTGAQPSSVAIGDFNGDGKPDLAVVISANAVSVLLEQ